MINIIADTLCGIPSQEQEKLAIPFVHQIIFIMGKVYREGIDIDTATFLKKLKTSAELPKTAAPPPEEYIPIFRKLAQKGDTVIVITPSKDMSGSYRSASIAKHEFPDADIRVVDTRTMAGGLGSIVLQALYWVKVGWDADRIVGGIQSMALRERVFFLVDTLEYMEKGERISGPVALIGTMLQIKPILTIQDGKIDTYEKIRTKEAGLARLKELVEEGCPHRPDAWLSVSHCSALKTATQMASDFKKSMGFKYIPIYDIPPAIVVNTGPKLLSVSFFTSN